ncbi:MAG: response regulator [Acidobacteria bacterium]|nr:MAG: response regulator [Acidobacteriota bacterium]
MATVVALVDDLFFQMKLAETAKQLGVEVKVAANGEALMGLMASEPRLVIVDLNARNQPIGAIEKLRQARKDVRVVGFLSHVQKELAAQAQAAGCDEVLPRSSFTQNLAAILSSAKD